MPKRAVLSLALEVLLRAQERGKTVSPAREAAVDLKNTRRVITQF